jgi:hypothetical protein
MIGLGCVTWLRRGHEAPNHAEGWPRPGAAISVHLDASSILASARSPSVAAREAISNPVRIVGVAKVERNVQNISIPACTWDYP